MTLSLRFTSAAALALTAAAGGVFLDGGRVQAATTFDPSVATTIVETYTTGNLSTNKFVQFGFSSAPAGIGVSNVEFSSDGTNYTLFNTNSFTTTGAAQYTEVYNPIGAIGVPFYVRYTIAPGASLGAILQSTLLTNNNAFTTDGGVLASQIGNNFALVDRSLTATAATVPGPLPLMGAAAAFGASRRLRRRVSLGG